MKILRLLFMGLCTLMFLAGPAQAEIKYETATFAGGCFWCMSPPFEALEGVKQVLSGYIGGRGNNPTYDDYAEKGYIEAVQISYDPSKTNYIKLLEVYWQQVDPTDSEGQFVDRGQQYQTAIFYYGEKQKKLAEKSKQALGKSGRYDKPIVTKILKASTFYKAEEYHQKFHIKNPLRYKLYRANAGRDQYLKKVWGSK